MRYARTAACFAATPAAVACVAATLLAAPASANTLRFSATAPGGIVATGNTLGLSKDLNVNGPGVRDSIGTFISLDDVTDVTPPNDVNPYPHGTSADWHADGSAATLVLPDGTELGATDVLYAELLWGGSYKYGTEDVTADLDDTVTLETGGASLAVAPDPATALTLDSIAISGFTVEYYARSADVTAFVRQHRSGVYDVRGVPATQTDTINSLNAAGWTLVVAYRNDAEALRNLTVFIGGSFVDENSQEDYSVDGFCAPPSGEIVAKAAISAIEGDANLAGDQLLIAPTAAGPFVALEGPNNPVDNFFCSQMNDDNGDLDTRGTFGAVNQDPLNAVNVVGGRQGWDVTTIPLSSSAGQLVAGQQTAVLRTITTGDSYVPTLAAFQIDVNAPNLTTSSILPDQTSVQIGDLLTVTSVAHNSGLVDASALVFSLTVPTGLTLESFTSDGVVGDVTGQAVTAASLAAGADEGTLAPNQDRTIVVQMRVTGASPTGLFFVQPTWSYDYVTCNGSQPSSETFTHGTTVTFVPPPSPDAGSASDVDAGSTGTDAGSAGGEGEGEGEGGASGGEGEGGGGVVIGGEGEGAGLGENGHGAGAAEGCGCASGGAASAVGTAMSFAALAALGRVARRRRHFAAR